MDTAIKAPKAPLAERVNLRALVFTGIVLFLLGWPVYTFLSEYLTHGIHDRGGYKEVDLKALGFFEMNPFNASEKDVPAQFRALDGQKVLLKGEIWASREVNDVKDFELVYSIGKCCFGGPPKVQERVYTTVAAGKTFKYAGEGYHDVMGTLRVTMKKDPATGQVTEVYHLDADSVQPVR